MNDWFVLRPRPFRPILSDTEKYPPPGEGLGEYRLVQEIDHRGVRYRIKDDFWARTVNDRFDYCNDIPTPLIRGFAKAPTEKMQHVLRIVVAYSMHTGAHWRYLSIGWHNPDLNTEPFVCDRYDDYVKTFTEVMRNYRALARENYKWADPKTLYVPYARYLVFYDDGSYDAGNGSVSRISEEIFDYPMRIAVGGASGVKIARRL